MTLEFVLPAWLQSIFPTHFLSRSFGMLARCEIKLLKNWAIRQFISHYHVDMAEAIHSQPQDYLNFHDFFTRRLKPGARQVCEAATDIASPVDGTVSELGRIESGKLLQAKGHYYDLSALLAGHEELARLFAGGHFLTAYLSPKDYHRVHMPLTGSLLEMMYVPGRLFSVNQQAVNDIPGLFARNERVVNVFQTDAGCVAVILVGAMIVGSMHTQWHGQVTPCRSKSVQDWYYNDSNISISRGEEMGLFTLGSTVILLFEKDRAAWDSSLQPGCSLSMGQRIGQYVTK